MSKNPKRFLNHILDETDYLIEESKGVSRDEFADDLTLQKAFVRSLEIIGEATKNLSDDFREANVQIEWKEVAGMRDKLIHHYFGVDYDLVWDVVKNEIPSLASRIREILG